MSQTISKLEAANAALGSSSATLQDESAAIKAEQEALAVAHNLALSKASEEHAAVLERAEKAERDHGAAGEALKVAETEKGELQAEHSSVLSTFKDLEAVLVASKEKHVSLSSDLAARQTDLAAHAATIEQLRKEQVDLVATSSKHSSRADDLVKSLAKKEAEAKAATADATKLRTDLGDRKSVV